MNFTEKRTHVKTIIANAIAERFPDAIQIDDYEFVIPVTVEGETFYAALPIGTKDTRGTKASDKRPARDPFTVAEAVAGWEEVKKERAEIAKLAEEIKRKRNA